MITFSFRPRRKSTLPSMAASVSTRVVSWNEASEMNESVESEAFVMPEQHRLALRRMDVVRIARTVHQRIGRLHPLVVLHVDVHVSRQ
jgi:hypothetical protein